MKELAEFLKDERLSRNLTLEDISGRSGMSLRMLESVEECEFERFGAPLLIRNTIRAYCKVLQIEPEPLIRRFSSQIEAYNIQDAGIRRYGQQMKILHKKRRMIGLPVFVLLLISTAVFWGGTWVSNRLSKQLAPPDADRVFTQEDLPAELQERPAPVRVEKPGVDLRKADKAIREAEIHIKESESTAQEAGKADGAAERSGEESIKDLAQETDASPRMDFRLGSTEEAVADDRPIQNAEGRRRNKFAVEADDKVWIQVRIDDREIQSAMLHPGDRREWGADKFLHVVVGNAGGIYMKWNGQPLSAPRDPGRVLRFRLPDFATRED